MTMLEEFVEIVKDKVNEIVNDTPKRKRGRPRKPRPVNNAPKRPRGRPRKTVMIQDAVGYHPTCQRCGSGDFGEIPLNRKCDENLVWIRRQCKNCNEIRVFRSTIEGALK